MDIVKDINRYILNGMSARDVMRYMANIDALPADARATILPRLAVLKQRTAEDAPMRERMRNVEVLMECLEQAALYNANA